MRNLLLSIALKQDFDHHLCFGKISWYFYQCEDFKKTAWSVQVPRKNSSSLQVYSLRNDSTSISNIFQDFLTKIIRLETIFGFFKKIICGSNNSTRILNCILDLKKILNYNLNYVLDFKMYWDCLLSASVESC